MAKKIDVILTAVLNDGQTVKQPGETVSMDEKQARKLAALGMVKLQVPEKPVKKAKNGGSKSVPPRGTVPPPDDDDPDVDGSGDTIEEQE
jgi:hypothetical protein